LKIKGKHVIWPVYFDANRSRKMGRKVPKRLAVPSPRIEELEKALRKLKVEYEVRRGAAYPNTH